MKQKIWGHNIFYRDNAKIWNWILTLFLNFFIRQLMPTMLFLPSLTLPLKLSCSNTNFSVIWHTHPVLFVGVGGNLGRRQWRRKAPVQPFSTSGVAGRSPGISVEVTCGFGVAYCCKLELQVWWVYWAGSWEQEWEKPSPVHIQQSSTFQEWVHLRIT